MEGDDESLIAHGGNLKFSNNQPYTHGVKEDINELLRQTVELFDENETLRISYFQKVWHDMKFGLIFHGRQDYRELYEFTEDLFDSIKRNLMPSNLFALRSAAFYLLYAIYFKQPLRPIVKIRITFEEYSDLVDWMKELRSDTHWELVYCWAKLLTDHAFVFVASTQHLGLEFSSKNHKGVSDDQMEQPQYRETFFSSGLESLRKIHDKYTNLKNALISEKPTPYMRETVNYSGLSLSSNELPDKMANLINKINYKTNYKPKKKHQEIDINIGMRRKQIIAKSFGHGGDDSNDDGDAMEIKESIEENNKGGQKKKKKKSKKSAKRLQTGKKVHTDFDETTCDIRTLALSLEAVKEDPSLMNVFGDYGQIVDFQKRGKGRPKKFKEVGEKTIKVKKKKKTLKEKKSRKKIDDQNYDKTTPHDHGLEETRKKDKGIGKKSQPLPIAESKTDELIPDPVVDDFLTF